MPERTVAHSTYDECEWEECCSNGSDCIASPCMADTDDEAGTRGGDTGRRHSKRAKKQPRLQQQAQEDIETKQGFGLGLGRGRQVEVENKHENAHPKRGHQPNAHAQEDLNSIQGFHPG